MCNAIHGFVICGGLWVSLPERLPSRPLPLDGAEL